MDGFFSRIWFFEVTLGHYKRCDVQSFKKENWNDFIIKANYSRERVKGEKYFELWWNGKQINECNIIFRL